MYGKTGFPVTTAAKLSKNKIHHNGCHFLFVYVLRNLSHTLTYPFFFAIFLTGKMYFICLELYNCGVDNDVV